MRTWHDFAIICLWGPALAALLPACGSTDAPAETPESRGATVWKDQICASCHGEDAKGLHGPNITMSISAGIGSWTYQQVSDAVHLGKNKDGTDLCLLMTRFPVTDTTCPTCTISEAEMQDLYAYLKTKPVSDVMNQGDYCPKK